MRSTVRRILLVLAFLVAAPVFGQDLTTPTDDPEAPPVLNSEMPDIAPDASLSIDEPTESVEVSPVIVTPPKPKSAISIQIDLTKQKAYLLHDGKQIYESPISSGRSGHSTPIGDFEVIEKDFNHFSSLYGSIVDNSSGRVVIAGADGATKVPKGCHFKPAPMKNFMRFDGAAGMHAGILPGYAASHGCVRMPSGKAKLFYETVEVGSEVHVFGTAPAHVAAARLTPKQAGGPTVAVAVTDTPKRRPWLASLFAR